MGQYRAASLVLEDGCKMDPLHGQMRLHLESATQGVLRDLLEGMLPTPSFGLPPLHSLRGDVRTGLCVFDAREARYCRHRSLHLMHPDQQWKAT